jgi:hypothetical protein
MKDSRTELDSHADTSCFGKHSLIVSRTHHTLTVSPFLDSLGKATKIPIVTAALLAYDNPKTGKTIVLVGHQVLYFEQLEHNLLCPMQLRMNGVDVEETPKHLVKGAITDQHHAISSYPRAAGGLVIPMSLHGDTSYFPTRKPTRDEYENCTRYELTAPEPSWKPYSVRFASQEDSMIDKQLQVYDPPMRPRHVMSSRSRPLLDISNHDDFTRCISASVTSTATDAMRQLQESSVRSGKPATMDPTQLARTWQVGLDAAKQTLQKTTQRGVTSGEPFLCHVP